MTLYGTIMRFCGSRTVERTLHTEILVLRSVKEFTTIGAMCTLEYLCVSDVGLSKNEPEMGVATLTHVLVYS